MSIQGKEFVHNSRNSLVEETMLEHMVCIGAGIISTEFASKILGISDLHRVCASGIGCVNEIGQNFRETLNKSVKP